MSAAQRRQFTNRMRRIERSHRSRNRGGLGVLGRLSMSSVLVAFALGIAVKALIIANVSGGGYAQAMQELSRGNVIQQGLAWVMQPDPLTAELVRFVRLPS